MNLSKPKLWTKDFIIVSSINFFIALIFYLLLVTIAVYAVDEYHANASEAGLVTGIFIIGILFGRLFIGRFIETIGRRRTLFIGLILYSLTTCLYFAKLGLAFLLMNRFIHGVAMGVASTAAGTVVAQIIPAERKGEGIGYFSMSATLATAIGPFIGLFLSQHTNFQTIFSFCFALGVIALIIAFFLHVPPLKETAEKAAAKSFRLSDFLEPRALPISLIVLLSAWCYSGVLSFISFYAIELDLAQTASFFFVVYSAAVLLSRPFTGRLMDMKGANFIMYPAIIALAAGMLLFSAAETSFAFLLSGFLIGLGFGNIQSGSQAIAVKLTPPHRMGMATSTFFIFMDAGFGAGPYLLGLFIPITGYSNLYVILGGFVLAICVLYYLLHGRKESAEKREAKVTAAS